MKDAMTRDEFLDFLRDDVRAPVEKSAGRILSALAGDREKLEAFQLDRLHLDELIAQVEDEQFKDLDGRLEELSGPLRQGVSAMSESLTKVKNFAKGAELFAKVVGLVARVVALA